MEKFLIENMIIEPFGVNHITDVAEIHSQVMDGWSKESLVGDIANTSTQSFAAVYNGRAVAFCSYQVVDDAELIFVCTHKLYERQGIATRLLTHTITNLPPHINNIVLEVRSQNEKAVSLYNKLGFEKLGIRKNFYSHPADDAVVMEYIKNDVKKRINCPDSCLTASTETNVQTK